MKIMDLHSLVSMMALGRIVHLKLLNIHLFIIIGNICRPELIEIHSHWITRQNITEPIKLMVPGGKDVQFKGSSILYNLDAFRSCGGSVEMQATGRRGTSEVKTEYGSHLGLAKPHIMP